MSFKTATEAIPFSNGTEGYGWMSVWCDCCAHDHGMHDTNGEGGCSIILEPMLAFGGDDWRWPEAWIPEPDDGKHYLPSRLICTLFEPCEPCGGDPHSETRVEIVNQVKEYWRANS